MRKHPNGAQVLEKAQDLYSESRDKAAKGVDRAKSFIHEKPILSTLLGVGFGVLIGLWMKGRE